MTRTLVDNEQQALTELDARTRPAWFARADSLPFDLLTGDEFEVFCYLLIRAERPNRRTVYYGKTADAGRDIIAEDENGYLELVQCKNYQANVDASVVKADLAKVYVNVYRGSIPVRPEKVSFYVVPGLTAGATDLVTIRTEWTNVADQAIIAHWKKHVDSESEPPEELLELGRTWWPMQPPEPRSALTARARRFPSLIQSFFDVRTAVDNSAVYEIRDAVTAAVEANRQQYAEILKRLNAVTSVARPLRPEQVGEELSRMLREAQRDYPSIDFSVESTSSGHSLAIKLRGDDDQTPVGRLELPDDALGRQGLAKVQAFVDHGIEAKLDPGEYKWHLALHTPIVGIINSVPDEHRQLVLK